MCLPGYTHQYAFKYTDTKLQTLQDKDLILFLENSTRGGIKSVMGDRYVKSDDNRKIIYMDASVLYGHSISQILPCDEIEMWFGHPDIYMNELEEILKTPEDNGVGYFVEVHLKYADNKKEKANTFQLLLRMKFYPKMILTII